MIDILSQMDFKTIVAIGSPILSLLFAVFVHTWTRGESRHTAFQRVLKPLAETIQSLQRANNSRRTLETLKHSFGASPPASVAVRLDELFEKYGVEIRASEEKFREMEAEFASSSFRFPDRITTQLKTAKEALSELGRLVNEGFFDRADIQLAKVCDDYTSVTKTARGWRLPNPIVRIKSLLGSKPSLEDSKDDFNLSQREMDRLLELVRKKATTEKSNTFVVHPPRKLIDDPQITKSPQVIKELQDSVFVAVFQDGTTAMLSFVELIVFVFQLLILYQSNVEALRMMEAARPIGPRDINMTYSFSVHELMRPEMVKVLLEKVQFSDVASDDLRGGPAKKKVEE